MNKKYTIKGNDISTTRLIGGFQMEELLKVIVFQLKGQRYGVDIQQIRSIERMQDVTGVPGTSDFIKGVINLRDELTPIVDLKERLQIQISDYTDETRILIINVNNVQLGLIVDTATDVIDIDPAVIEASPKAIRGVNEAFIKGVAKLASGLLILLDFKRILNLAEVNEVQEVIEN